MYTKTCIAQVEEGADQVGRAAQRAAAKAERAAAAAARRAEQQTRRGARQVCFERVQLIINCYFLAKHRVAGKQMYFGEGIRTLTT